MLKIASKYFYMYPHLFIICQAQKILLFIFLLPKEFSSDGFIWNLILIKNNGFFTCMAY